MQRREAEIRINEEIVLITADDGNQCEGKYAALKIALIKTVERANGYLPSL